MTITVRHGARSGRVFRNDDGLLTVTGLPPKLADAIHKHFETTKEYKIYFGPGGGLNPDAGFEVTEAKGIDSRELFVLASYDLFAETGVKVTGWRAA